MSRFFPDYHIKIRTNKEHKRFRHQLQIRANNERPAWLGNARRALDEAVAGAYGWEEDFTAGRLTEEEILKRLFELNQARAARQ